MELSLEQQFNLRHFASQVEKMSEAQSKDFLKGLYAQMLYREGCYKQLLKHNWPGEPMTGFPPVPPEP